jgi:hypothetical protein
MGWHDCRVHAVSIGEYADNTLPPARMLLDIDYIVRWVQPAGRDRNFTFWIAPATLVFERAWNIDGRLGPLHEVMEIADVHRLDSPDSDPEPLWHIEGQNFEFRLRAVGLHPVPPVAAATRPPVGPHLHRARRDQLRRAVLCMTTVHGSAAMRAFSACSRRV